MQEVEESSNPLSLLDRTTIALLAFTLAFAAVALGTVQPWSEEVFVALAAALSLFTVVSLIRRKERPNLGGWTVVPLIGFPLLVVLQLLPSTAWTSIVSPAAVALRQQFAAPHAGPIALDGATVSLYAYETARHLRLLAAVIAVFSAAAVVLTNRSAVKPLLLCLSVVGVSIAVIAAIHSMLGLEKIYGLVSRPSRSGETTAPFINGSHFAQFMNTSIGASMALLLTAVADLRHRHTPRFAADWLELLRQGMLRGVLFPAIAIVCCSLSVVASASRGGMLALLVAAIVTAIVSAHRKSVRLITSAFVTGVVLIGVGALLFSQRVQEKVLALTTDQADGGRWELLKSQVPIWRSFPATGVGFGTFEYVFPRYDLVTTINISSHAENEYAQMLTELGAPGLILLVWFMVLVWRAWWRCILHGGARGLIAAGLGFSLTAVTLHSALDFGQHLPANAAATAITAAILLRLGCSSSVQQSLPIPSSGSRFAPAALFMLFAVLAASVFAADRHRRATAAVDEASRIAEMLAADAWQGTDSQYTQWIDIAQRSVELAPRNARAQYALGTAKFWNLLRERQARLDPAADQRLLATSLSSFHAAMTAAPLFGPPYSLAGQARRAFGDFDAGDALIRTAAELSPQDGWTLALAGEVSLRNGDVDAALSQFRRAISTAGIGARFIILRLLQVYDRPDLALELAGDNTEFLNEIAAALKLRNRVEAEGRVRERIIEAALRRVQSADAAASQLAYTASLLRERGRDTEALPLYRRALALEPSQHRWRLATAQILASQHEYAAAEQEVRTILRDQPDWAEARSFGAELRLRAATQPAK